MVTYPYNTRTSRAEGASFVASFFSVVANGTAELVEGYDFSSSSSSSFSSQSSQSSQTSQSSASSLSSASSSSYSSSSRSSLSSLSSFPEQVTYAENDPSTGQAAVIGYYGNISSITIAPTYNGMPVVQIAAYALLQNWWDSVHLFSIIVPSSVTYIDYYAFDGVGTYAPGYANVYFSGNAPAVDPDAFLGFNGTIYYHSAYAYDPAHNPSGFTTPTWQGHATATW